MTIYNPSNTIGCYVVCLGNDKGWKPVPVWYRCHCCFPISLSMWPWMASKAYHSMHAQFFCFVCFLALFLFLSFLRQGLILYSNLSSNLWSSCLSMLSARITDMYYHTQLTPNTSEPRYLDTRMWALTAHLSHWPSSMIPFQMSGGVRSQRVCTALPGAWWHSQHIMQFTVAYNSGSRGSKALFCTCVHIPIPQIHKYTHKQKP